VGESDSPASVRQGESLPAILFRHAAERPEEPWLFVREGWDWHWSPFDEVADRVAFWRGPLAAAFPPAARLAFPDLPLPRAVALDLAIQAAGATAVPIHLSPLPDFDLPAALTRLHADAWLGAPPRPLPPGVRPFELPEPTPGGGPGRGPGPAAGGVLVTSSSPDPRELAQADLLTAARVLQSALGSSRQREITVLAPPLAGEPARQLLAWATLAGAVLILEPEPAAVAATAAWARPTVFLGDPATIAILRRRLPGESRLSRLLRSSRPPALPFGRLHTLLVSGVTGLSLEDIAFWTARGVRVLPLPSLA
jgi:hypothetical protein